jgi:hypothetical protein
VHKETPIGSGKAPRLRSKNRVIGQPGRGDGVVDTDKQAFEIVLARLFVSIRLHPHASVSCEIGSMRCLFESPYRAISTSVRLKRCLVREARLLFRQHSSSASSFRCAASRFGASRRSSRTASALAVLASASSCADVTTR